MHACIVAALYDFVEAPAYILFFVDVVGADFEEGGEGVGTDFGDVVVLGDGLVFFCGFGGGGEDVGGVGELFVVGGSLGLDGVLSGAFCLFFDVFFGEATLNYLIWVVPHTYIFKFYDYPNIFLIKFSSSPTRSGKTTYSAPA